MSIASPPVPNVIPAQSPAALQPSPDFLGSMRPFTVDEYHRMIEAGVVTEDDPVELLEGWIVYKMGRNPPHDITIALVQAALQGRVTEGWHVRNQSGLTTTDSEPEPDLIIVAGNIRDYAGRHPGPQDTALVIEVANTSLRKDREGKGRLYARAGIAAYWLVNVEDARVEVYADPTGPATVPAYRSRTDFGVNDSAPLTIPGQAPVAIPVRDLLP